MPEFIIDSDQTEEFGQNFYQITPNQPGLFNGIKGSNF